MLMHNPKLVAAAQKRLGADYNPAVMTAVVTEKAFAQVWEAKGFVSGPAPADKKEAKN